MNTNEIDQLNQFISSQLNQNQQSAVAHKSGPLLIIAGAGSGKTRVITTRIVHLILNEQISPHSIVALTFTNKAANEMKERITQFLGDAYEIPFIGTFHAYCLRLLKQNTHLLSYPFISILDEDDQHKIIQNIINRTGITKKITAKQIGYQISTIKNQSLNPLMHSMYQYDPLLQEIYHAYEQEKKASRCFDFDDLLLETVRMFQKHPEYKHTFQSRIRHILVDEYQDTNIIQHELLKHMAQSGEKTFGLDSICAVGDEDQSIYSWRGATVANIMNFTHDFPKTTIIKIEQNYRSVQSILDVANTIIAYNKNRNPKKLWSEKSGSDRIRSIACLSEYQEAETIAQFLKLAAKKQSLNSIALLYRTHFQSRAIEEALLKHSIPYKIIGGIQFYERKEIKDMLAYLKLIANPFDRASFFRVINCPLRGLGNKFEELFYEAWNNEPFATMSDIALQLIERKEITGLKKDALMQFITLFSNRQATDAPGKAMEHIIQSTQYFSYLKEAYDKEEAISKIENVKELIQAINHLESQGIKTITLFLEEVTLMQEQIQAESNQKDPVLLMTLHAAKGLEFHTIILTGLEEGIIPSSRSLADENAIEEERRLFYVGITRAQERLLLTYSRYRYHYGTMTDQRPSRFLMEVPPDMLRAHDCSYWNNTQIQDNFSAWLGGKSISVEKPESFSVHKKIIQPASALATTTHSGWKKNQPVSHATFGIGLIQEIEPKGSKTYLHIKFKFSTKKIESQFVQAV